MFDTLQSDPIFTLCFAVMWTTAAATHYGPFRDIKVRVKGGVSQAEAAPIRFTAAVGCTLTLDSPEQPRRYTFRIRPCR